MLGVLAARLFLLFLALLRSSLLLVLLGSRVLVMSGLRPRGVLRRRRMLVMSRLCLRGMFRRRRMLLMTRSCLPLLLGACLILVLRSCVPRFGTAGTA